MRPENSVKDSGYLTPDSIPDERLCRSFSIPNDTAWLGVFMGAIAPLLNPETWREYGALTPDECAEQWQDIFFSFESACALEIGTPFWDSGTNVGDQAVESEQPWYGRLTA